ncbi:bifunctional proline dehydrogenase/L-glutamate gamma-semialdehyde dehydrogenase PutA [bacterium]|nr:bifunctional proline dehydrogenase/L-glutamate gamma-semialdehyde dehydrogenase PutA [bacterium]
MPQPQPLSHLNEHYLADESQTVETLLGQARLPEPDAAAVVATAADLVRGVRARKREQSSLDALMHEYDLSSQEGVLLMCLAESLLRIPDEDTAEKLIADKLRDADWGAHMGKSDRVFVNASTWGLMLTGKLIKLDQSLTRSAGAALGRLLSGSSEPVVRGALRQAMRLMGGQFVMGRSIGEALRRAGEADGGVRHSFDMLGEAALTAADAKRYHRAYADAIAAIGKHLGDRGHVTRGPGISVKLSALHPRYEFTQRERVLRELTPKLLELALAARAANIGLTVDAEEADRLMLALNVFERVFRSDQLSGWDGFGLAVQAYQKRALPQLEWLRDLAGDVGRRIPVRLVKGAYWDTEIKRGQEQGLPAYPVFTRKSATDVSYLACARFLLRAGDAFYPQFASHNAHTVAAIAQFARDGTRGKDDFEYQRLHGMGEALYGELERQLGNAPCRIYAPVGSHEDLLPYLVRRLLENGANSSFVNRILDDNVPVDDIVKDPVAELAAIAPKPHPAIPLPAAMYGDRRNSLGRNLADAGVRRALSDALIARARQDAATTTAGAQPITSPADRREIVGTCVNASTAEVEHALLTASLAAPNWADTPVDARASIIEAAGRAMNDALDDLCALLVREAGKTWADAVAEVREAVDFCNYYALQARRLMAEPTVLRGPTGESNSLQLAPRGLFVCISPWNFPLAIFTGQVAAALATGNTVVAKPAEQTPLIARRAVEILRAAGVPRDALQFVAGDGETVGARLTSDPRVSGVVFTGSLPTAKAIAQALAGREGAIAPLIAETGGLNCMLVDSSALPEQVVKDVLQSAFGSAGQRCSALRVLMLQQDIADGVLPMLAGAMQELQVGNPADWSTDVGPVIDDEALGRLREHARRMDASAELIARAPSPDKPHGTYFRPCAYRVASLEDVGGETFGPVLHVLTWKASELDGLIDQINASGFGLTLGVHSRIDSIWKRITQRARVGNAYVNRNMVGAVVGVQPFGGEGLSGTGPKAGGPHYLPRFCTERSLTVNTAAVGGNTSLLTLE